VDAPALDREADAARRAYRVKAAWGVSCGILAALLAALGVLWVRQERRYLDLKAEFVATVSHELKTPLASVRLLAETLERRLPAGDGRDYPARIVREVDRLAFLVENILSFHRISKGKVMPRLADVNVREVVEAVHRDRSGGRDVSLSAEAVPDTWLRADPELLHLVFSNLYENSWRHGVRRPVEIRVSAEPRAGAVEVLFADNGPGLPQPGGVSNGAARHGSGLGLEICRRIVALHGGSMRVVKSGPEGTTFGMSLPAS